ncbi:retrotransposon protein, putative, ty1-copia subclass [Tanacetum coccineum]
MRIDELHKFSDGTLNDVRTALDDILKRIRMKYLPQTYWKKVDKDRAGAMIQAIDKQLKNRRIMRSLEKFVGISNPWLPNQNLKDQPGYPLDSVEVLRFNTTAGNPVKKILLKIELSDHEGIYKDGHGAKKIGPLEIVEKINSNAYRLKLPSHIRCSDVFNVKHLLPYHGDSSDDDPVVNSRANFVYPGENDAGPSIEERAILFLEAQDRVKKGPFFKRSTRTRHPRDRLCLYIDAEEHELGDHVEPANYKAALKDPESEKWLAAMNVKMQSMKDNNVWELVELLPNVKTVGHKWVFKKKTDMDGAVHTFKSHPVAKGFTQTHGEFQTWNYPNAIKAEIKCTRPDVAFAQNITSRFQQNPGELHWTTVTNILKYLRNTKDMFLVYRGDMKQELKVSCYTDAGYLTDADDLKSQTRYIFILNGGAIDWKSTKQSIFATSSTDAEYIATFDAWKEAVWIRKFIFGLNVVPTIEEPITMYCENTGAIAIANDHGVTKGA